MTNGEFVSRIINTVNALTKDVRISKRWVLGVGKQKAASYTTQQWDQGGLFGEESLFTTIRCLEMIEIDRINCCITEFRLCKTLMRSRERIPGILFARLRPLVLSVTSVDGDIILQPVSLRKYTNDSKRQFGHITSDRYYYFDDGYLYVPDFHIELLNVKVITTEQNEALKLSACKDESDSNACKSIYDYEFIAPAKLIEYIVKETEQEIMNKLNVPTDDNPDMNTKQQSNPQ